MKLPVWLEQALPELILWGTILSLATLLAVVVVVPLVVQRLPADYFSDPGGIPCESRMAGLDNGYLQL